MRLKALAITLIVIIMATVCATQSAAKPSKPSNKYPKMKSSGVLPPPESRVDPTSPSVGLRRIVAELERLHERSGSTRSSGLLQALLQARSADDRWGGENWDVPTVVAEIGEASQALLDSGPRDPEIDQLRSDLAAIARHIAVNVNTRVGEGPEGDAGRRSIAAGDELAASGDAGGAINAYFNASQDFALLTFKMSLFRSNLETALVGDVNAAAWALAKDGYLDLENSDGFGKARHPIDPPHTGFFENEQMNIASVSKNVTATAVVKLLQDDQSVTLDDSVIPYLPPNWKVGMVMNTITFKDLLRHESGLAQNSNPGDSYANIRTNVASDIQVPKQYTYQNINFALLKVLIPRLWKDGLEDWEAEYTASTNKAALTVSRYEEYIQQEVLFPLGIFSPQCGPGDETVLAYPYPYDGTSGTQSTDRLFCGGGAWHFSAEDLTNLMAKRQFTDIVLEPATKKLMKKNFLGYGDPVRWAPADGFNGTYYGHGGDLGLASGNAFHSCILEFPNGVNASLLLNSDTGTMVNGAPFPYQCIRLRDAYEQAWVIE